MVLFDNCDVVVNFSGLVAESASIDSENSLAALYSLGKIGIFQQAPQDNLKSIFSFSYYPEISLEPNFNVVSFIKQLTNEIWSGITLEIGGVTGYNCFLQSYSLTATPNNTVKAQATYITYFPLSGDVKSKSNLVNYNIDNSIAHGWTTFIGSQDNALIIPTYQLDYQFSANWEAVNIIGQTTPSQMILQEGSEQMIIIRDKNYNIQFSGQEYEDSFSLMNISLICPPTGYTGVLNSCGGIQIDMSSGQLIRSEIKSALDDIVRVSTTIRKFF